MKKSTLSFAVACAIAFIAPFAQSATGMLSQDPNAPASNYDVIQDHAYQAAAQLANSALTQNQQIVTQVNLVGNAVGQNAAAIGATNAAVGQNTQGVQQLTTQAGIQAQQTATNAAAIGKNTQGVQRLSTQVGQNTAAIQQQQAVSGNFATKPEVQTAQDRADVAFNNTEANRQALDTTNKKVAAHSAELANHESRIQTLEANNGYGSKFKALKNEVESNRKRASAGIAGVAAMSNIPQVIQGQTFAVGAGVGSTDGETGLAVGLSARAAESVVVKASVSNDTQHNFVVGAGMSYGW